MNRTQTIVRAADSVTEQLEARMLLSGTPLTVDETQVYNGMQLRVAGTTGDDVIAVARTPAGLVVSSGTGWSTTLPGDYASILINGGSGNDTITVDGSVLTDVVLYGGEGNDNLSGGSGGDHLYGGGGTNVLNGNAGDDALVTIGGSAADTATGGVGRDSFWVDAAGSERVTDLASDESARGALHRVGSFAGSHAASTVPAGVSDMRLPSGGGIMSGVVMFAPRQEPAPTPQPTPQPFTPLAPANVAVSLDVARQDLSDPEISRGATGYTNFAAQPLFGTRGPTADDIKQGQIGDCYFLAVLSSLAKVNPDRIEQAVVDLGDGTYAVRFMRGDAAVYVRVDADLPTNAWGGLSYADFGRQGSIWVGVVEKAYTYFRTDAATYASLTSGWMEEGYTALGLSPQSTFNAASASALVSLINTDLSAGKSVTFAIATPPPGTGLVGGHAYMVDSVTRDAQGNLTGLRLRNPWALDGYSSVDGLNDGYSTLTSAQVFQAFMGYTSAAA